MVKSNFSIAIICCLTLTLLLFGCTAQQKTSLNSQNNPTISETPAYLKCINDGGQDKIVYGANGQVELCLFSDGSACEQGAYYAGKCLKGECIRTCGAIGTRSEGWYDCNGKLLFWDKCSNETAQTAGSC